MKILNIVYGKRDMGIIRVRKLNTFLVQGCIRLWSCGICTLVLRQIVHLLGDKQYHYIYNQLLIFHRNNNNMQSKPFVGIFMAFFLLIELPAKWRNVSVFVNIFQAYFTIGFKFKQLPVIVNKLPRTSTQ